MTALSYVEAHKIVERAIADHRGSNDPTAFAYMLARAALLHIRMHRGDSGAAEVAYRIGDELAGGAS